MFQTTNQMVTGGSHMTFPTLRGRKPRSSLGLQNEAWSTAPDYLGVAGLALSTPNKWKGQNPKG